MLPLLALRSAPKGLLSDLSKRISARPRQLFTRITARHLYLLGSLLLVNVLWLLPATTPAPAGAQEGAAQRAAVPVDVTRESERPTATDDAAQLARDEGAEDADAPNAEIETDAAESDSDDSDAGDEDGGNDEEDGKEDEQRSSDKPRPAVVRTTTHAPKELPGAYKRLWAQLKKQPSIFTRRRLKQRGQISCGGSGCVVYRTWDAIAYAHPGLNFTLPQDMPPLANIANMVETGCKRGSKDPTCNPKLNGKGATPPPTTKPRCAVVGNSGKLRWEQHGAAIDATDIVIRFNQGRTKGFERQVGRKSTFRIYNGPYVEPKQSGEVTVAQLRDPAIKAWVKSMEKHQDVLAYMFDPEFLCQAWEWVGKEGDKPSSGLVGILFALSMCRFVDVYGFQYDAYFDETMRPHYYDWERPKAGRENAHPFARELSLYLLLQASGKLALH